MGAAATSANIRSGTNNGLVEINQVDISVAPMVPEDEKSGSVNNQILTPSVYYSDNDELVKLIKNNDENWDLLFKSLIREDYKSAVTYARAARKQAQFTEDEANRLSVTQDFQKIKSLFIQYLEFKKVVCDNYGRGAEYFDAGSESLAMQYFNWGTDNLTKLGNRVEEIDLLLKEGGY